LVSVNSKLLRFTDKDLDFIVSHAARGSAEPERLKRAIVEDDKLRAAMVSDDSLFERVMNDDEVFLRVSPTLYFEILLRKAHSELEVATYTLERSGRENIPVFDTDKVLEFMKRPGIVEYLATMMASFMKIQSYVVPVRVRRGVRRRVRYNDMDVDSLIKFASDADPMDRFRYYKRIGDVCLFVSGVFPGHTHRDCQQMAGGKPSAIPRTWRMRRSFEDYEREGAMFYRLAQEHPTARTVELAGVFGALKENFAAARKPLTYMANRFLHAQKQQLFGSSPV
jgi:hypothetical protein